jgi:ATP-dependent Clp protease ATP-binding subunit ClpA
MLSKNLELSLHRALNIAMEYKHAYATLEHLLLSLSEDPDARAALKICCVNMSLLCERLKNFLSNDLTSLVTENINDTKPTSGFQRVVHRAAIHAHAEGKKEVSGLNVLAEILSEQESFAVYFLNEQNVTRGDILNFIARGVSSAVSKFDNLSSSNPITNSARPQRNEEEEREFSLNAMPHKEIKETPSPLTNYCINLNKLAVEGQIDILIGREQETERTIEVLCRRTKNNPLYVGEPGVGKTAIAEGLALRIVRGNVPETLKNAIVFSLDMGSLVAGTRYRGDFEERVKSVIKEIQKIPSAILFIDEIHTIMGAGATSGGSLDAGNLLKPALARGILRCIGATTFKEYKNHFDKDQALARRFQKIIIEEPSIENTIKILKGLKPYYEEHHAVHYTAGAIEAAVTLSERFIHGRHLPDKAIDVLDEAGAYQKINNKNKQRFTITVKDIETTISKIVNMPIRSVSNNDINRIQGLENALKNVIFGQDNAISELTTAIKLSRAGLRNPKKPMGCYLFSGPTGVGKTELAKQVSESMNMSFIRLDMSEYMESHSVSRLIGSPPGYIGFDQGGILTDAISKSPYSVVLFDEIEKAHKDIYNILLQIMDYGSLTDHTGKHTSFLNSIVIMTTNAGAYEMSRPALGFGRESREGEDQEQINRLFSPEFRNRLDAIIPFSSLDKDVVTSVIDKFIKQLEEQLADRSVRITISPTAKQHLCSIGYDVKNGARTLERIISEKIKKPLANEILFGKLSRGGDVTVSFNSQDLEFNL